MNRGEASSAQPLPTPDATPITEEGRRPLWTNSTKRKLSRLYLYTSLPLQKIIEVIHVKNPHLAPGRESANKAIWTLLDKEPRWLHPQTESDMGRRLNELSFSPIHSPLPEHLLASDPESLKKESGTSRGTLDIPPFHQYSSPLPIQDGTEPIFQSFQVRNFGERDTSSITPLPAKTTPTSTQDSTTEPLLRVLKDYPEPLIRNVEQLTRRSSISLDVPAKEMPSVSNPAFSHTTWLNDEDAPPSLPDRPYFLPGELLNLDLLLQHQPPCFPDAEQHANRSCLCFAQDEIVASAFVTIEGVTLYGQQLLQNGLADDQQIIPDGFGNSILHFLAARGLFEYLLRAVVSDRCGSILNSCNTAGQTFLHTLNRSYLSNPDLLLDLLRVLSDRGFDIYKSDHYGRTVFHLLLADDVPQDTFNRVTGSLGLSSRVKRDAFNMTPTPRPKPTMGIHYPFTEEMDLDPPASDPQSSPETYASSMILKSAELLGFIRSASKDPAAEYSDGSNGLHCLAAATLSQSSMSRQYWPETAAKRTNRARRMEKKPRDLDSSSEKMNLRLNILEGLLGAGVDPNYYDCNGNTPLMAFVALLPEDDDYKLGPQMLGRLLESGANIHARNRRGETALHIAVRCGRKLAMRTLVQHGANVHTRDAAGRSLLEVIDVKIRGLRDQDVKEYAHFEACRAWLSGKAHAVHNPTFMQEWAIESDSLPPTRELEDRARYLQLATAPTGPPGSVRSRNWSGEVHGIKGHKAGSETLFSRSSLPETSRRDEINTLNSVSRVSQTWSDFAPRMSDVTEEFSRAILLAMRSDIDSDAANYWSSKHALPHIRAALKTFSKSAKVDTSAAHQAIGVESIRYFRSRIAQRVHQSILAQDQAPENGKASVNSKERDSGEKSSSSSSTNTTDSSLDEPAIKALGKEGTFTIPTVVLECFTQQQAFDDLVRTAEQLFERYHSPKMSLIRRVTSVSLRRYLDNPNCDNGRLCAMFDIKWNLRESLENNYEMGIRQKLQSIVAITGGTNNAQLCSVGEYLETCWPTHHDDLLLAIEMAMTGKGSSDMNSREPPTLALDASMKTVTVRGSEEFIISIAQQVAWLAAVCQEKRDQLTYAYVGFKESARDASEPPRFVIDVAQEAVPSEQDNGRCWTNLIGPAALVQGFPVPERKHDEKGLEADIRVMAAISGTPRAVTFGGGFVFKGRCHALVPIERLLSSIQWHVLDTYPKRLEWEDIDKACPTRLRGTQSNENLWEARSFFGWCPRVLDLLGTERFQYSSVRYSEARTPSNRAQVDKLVFGFSQWVTLTADISLGRNDGVLNQRADDYETLLKDARSTHVILHDTVHKRATQTNAEDLILHLILHRSRIVTPTQEGGEASEVGEALEFANPDRRARSTRQIMLSNAEQIVSIRRQVSSPEPEIRRFKNEVKLLYSMIDGLWAHNHASGGDAKPFKLGFDLGQNVHGWEYMDILDDSKWMPPKSINLQRSSGDWHQYAKDIRALVLFGANFGDVLLPELPNAICSDFTSLPRDACYLAVRVDSLEYLFRRQGSLEDQKKLTDSGLTIQGNKDLFKPCMTGARSHCNKPCSSNHLVRLVGQSSLTRNYCPVALEKDGAVIIGQAKNGSFLWGLQSRQILQATIISSLS